MSILKGILLAITVIFFLVVSIAAIVWPTGGFKGCIDSCSFTSGFPFQDGTAGYDIYAEREHTIIDQLLPFTSGLQISNPLAAFANVAIVLIVSIGGYKLVFFIKRKLF